MAAVPVYLCRFTHAYASSSTCLRAHGGGQAAGRAGRLYVARIMGVVAVCSSAARRTAVVAAVKAVQDQCVCLAHVASVLNATATTAPRLHYGIPTAQHARYGRDRHLRRAHATGHLGAGSGAVILMQARPTSTPPNSAGE